MKTYLLLLTALVFLLVPVAPVWADVTITEEEQSPDGDLLATTRIRVGSDRVRVETGSGATEQAFVYRGDLEVFWMIDYSRNAYMEMSVQDMEQMVAQTNNAFAGIEQQIQQQLQGLPPEQQALVQQALGARGRGGIPPQAAQSTGVEYQLVNSGETVGEWTADRYEGTENGVKRWDVWAIDWAEADLSPSDFAAFETLAEAIDRMSVSNQDDGNSFFTISDDEDGYSGLPVQRVSYQNGQPDTRYAITDINREPIEPAAFELEPGLTLQQIPGL